jgi:hypothetical protein
VVPAAAPGAPQLGTFQADKSKYYPGVVVDPISGRHYNADTGITTNAAAERTEKPKEIELEWDEPAGYWTMLGRFSAVVIGLLGVGALVAHLAPAIYVVPTICIEFIAALLMPIFRIAPWADEDADGVGLFAVLTIIGGPAVALLVYGIYSLLRQDTNTAVLGAGAITFLARVCCGLMATHFTLGSLTPWTAGFSLTQILINLSGFVTLAGWYCASVFHKLNE